MQLTFPLARSHWDHPYNNVRHQIANTLSTLLGMDIPIMGAPGEQTLMGAPGVETGGESTWNVGRGFPTIKAVLCIRQDLFRLIRIRPSMKIRRRHRIKDDL